ncbi:hypothetical protein WN51_00913 [Melipona quadrifasciata]|uniref:Uncharacterized protein n=1 Tax=Melipona quadrifasciata TaxID=166423 RepID=A0A0N0U4D6_9HYME|nr:hypothetical protein WN51_00913 [Melipona quadrifasciata]
MEPPLVDMDRREVTSGVRILGGSQVSIYGGGLAVSKSARFGEEGAVTCSRLQGWFLEENCTNELGFLGAPYLFHQISVEDKDTGSNKEKNVAEGKTCSLIPDRPSGLISTPGNRLGKFHGPFVRGTRTYRCYFKDGPTRTPHIPSIRGQGSRYPTRRYCNNLEINKKVWKYMCQKVYLNIRIFDITPEYSSSSKVSTEQE